MVQYEFNKGKIGTKIVPVCCLKKAPKKMPAIIKKSSTLQKFFKNV